MVGHYRDISPLGAGKQRRWRQDVGDELDHGIAAGVVNLDHQHETHDG